MGSGGGIELFTEGKADFGASDAGMTDEQIDKVKGGVQLLPVTAANVVLAYHLPGFSETSNFHATPTPEFSWGQSPIGTTRKSQSRTRGQACRS